MDGYSSYYFIVNKVLCRIFYCWSRLYIWHVYFRTVTDSTPSILVSISLFLFPAVLPWKFSGLFNCFQYKQLVLKLVSFSNQIVQPNKCSTSWLFNRQVSWKKCACSFTLESSWEDGSMGRGTFIGWGICFSSWKSGISIYPVHCI